MTRTIASVFMVAVIGVATAASATTINVNVISGAPAGNPNPQPLNGTDQTGFTPVNPNGTFWNDVNGDLGGAAGVALVESTVGAMTGITLSQTSTGGNSFANFSFSQEGLVNGAPDILGNYLAANNGFGPPLAGDIEYQLTGLDTETVYNFFFVAVGDTPGQGATITLDGTAAVATGTSPSGPLTEGDNFVSFRNVTAPTGTLAFTLNVAPAPGSQGFAALSGFQIQTVPEPATAGLATLLLVAGAGVRRRR